MSDDFSNTSSLGLRLTFSIHSEFMGTSGTDVNTLFMFFFFWLALPPPSKFVALQQVNTALHHLTVHAQIFFVALFGWKQG